MNYGERLKYFRELKGLSGKALAEKAGLVPSQVSKIESNAAKPSLDSLTRLCGELGITLAEFFSETEPKLPPELYRLLENAKQLKPSQIEAINQFILSMTESTASFNDPLPIEPGEVLAAHRTDDPLSDLPTEALISVAQFKEACRREILEELEMEIKNRKK